MLLGFEHIELTLERVARASGDGYPPYNIEEISGDRLRITLAVAGFSEAELAIEAEGRQLTVRGKQDTQTGERHFIHRGIAARQFQKSFVLADGMDILGATLRNGLLDIELRRPVAEACSRRIAIGESDGKRDQPAKLNVDYKEGGIAAGGR